MELLLCVVVVIAVVVLLLATRRRAEPIWSYAPASKARFTDWTATEVDQLWP